MTRQSAPYHFVPVHPELAILDKPVFHDIQQNSDEFWSGELECEMSALTPMLVGHFQYHIKHLPSVLRESAQRDFNTAFDAEKTVLEPLMDSSVTGSEKPGRVIIPGTSIKGMLRHSIQALLSAPMERVAEKKLKFRPKFRRPKSDYRDSIVCSSDPEYQVNSKDRTRKILSPCPSERNIQHGVHKGAPESLSGARNLFGYCSSEKDKVAVGVGEDDFSLLSGRISVNFALELITKEGERFVGQENDFFVPLRPLASPKLTAVEHYLTQDRISSRKNGEILCTFGENTADKIVGNLRGRKFFLHQPLAGVKPDCFNLSKIPCVPDDKRRVERKNLATNQSMLARYISKDGSKFRFSIRFRDLRTWEIGALIFVLNCDEGMLTKFLEQLEMKDAVAPKMREWLKSIAQWKPGLKNPLIAHKIGHGRPLGLGSINMRIENTKRLVFDGENMPSFENIDLAVWSEKLVGSFAQQINKSLPNMAGNWVEKVLLPWLQVHRYAGRKRYDYPRPDSPDKKGDYHIYLYHSKIRQAHHGRKGGIDVGLADLSDLDREDLRK
ncbi:MAG: hypothetical protein HQM09_21900 [Candidatus Riflebacteria bacterium]|nr:hypothetical protein [Candidatus Riflebacteria bacterium]